jgi:23S rRNA (cytidine1920-2'-O)/16S rRNA (cytidine1409-2'-O)-methyltransferase
MAARRARLDAELVRRGLAASRTEAQRLVADGQVTVDGTVAAKPATMVGAGAALALRGAGRRWASRGGDKLAGALAALDIDPSGRWCLDAGASTGGFTDVLLQGGARRVVAVDVGYGQLDWRLRTDERVEVRERTNVRHLQPGDLPPPPPDLVVADLSFISLRLVLPALRAVADPWADHVLLVKPQFEAGPDRVGAGGVVRDPEVWRDALEAVQAAAAVEGLGLAGAAVSPLPGPAGNVEFFLHLRTGAGGQQDLLDKAVAQGRELAANV